METLQQNAFILRPLLLSEMMWYFRRKYDKVGQVTKQYGIVKFIEGEFINSSQKTRVVAEALG